MHRSNSKLPFFCHRPDTRTLVLFWTALFLASQNVCSGQNSQCELLVTVETDSLSGQKITRAQKNIIISDDGGKTGFALFGLLVDSTFIFNIRTVGGGACVNTGDKIDLIFADSSRLELTNMAQFNCEAKSSLYFSKKFNNYHILQSLLEKSVVKLAVWTKTKFVSKSVDPGSANKIRALLACFDASLGNNTFFALMKESIFSAVDVQPEFMGGYPAMLDYIKKNLRYPSIVRQRGVQGTVYVGFLVNKDGSITDVETVKGVHPDIDEEAERVIKLMPPWKPGTENQIPVTVRFVMPIKFKISFK